MDKGQEELLVPRPHFPLSLAPSLARYFVTETRNPNSVAAVDCRSSGPPLTNRLDEKERRDVLYLLAEPRFSGCRLLAAVDVLPRAPPRGLFPDSGTDEPPLASPSTRASPG